MVGSQGLSPIVTPLENKLRDIIKTDGPISVSHLMRIAANDTDYGYYQSRDPFGTLGDFITSPEITQAFGEIIGLWCLTAWQNAGCPDKTILIELGPGRGTLMLDILRTVKKILPKFMESIELHLVESGTTLRQQQRLTLKDYHVTWHDFINTIPQGPSLILANEFFDVLPIDQYLMTKDGWHEKLITHDPEENKFSFITVPVSKKKISKFRFEISKAETNSIFERNRSAEKYAESIAKRIFSNGIAALLIDYGYVKSGFGDTLQAVKSHRYYDPLTDIGNADLTAHVDFANLEAIFKKTGVAVHGPVLQRNFLTTLGIEHRTMTLVKKATTEQALLLIKGCQRLIAQNGMGSLFKVMAITPENASTPEGF